MFVVCVCMYSLSLFPSLFIFTQAHLPLSIAASGMPPLLYVTAHCIEMLLEVEVPHVHSAFKISGYTPAQVTGDGREMDGVT